MLNRIAELIVDSDELRGNLPVTLTSGWQFDIDRVRYVRRTVISGNTGSTVSFDTVRDSLFVLRNTEVLDRVFTLFGTEPSLRWNDLAERLSKDGSGAPTEYDEYIRMLFRLGLLRAPALHVDIHERDPLRAFAGALSSLGPRFAQRFAGPLEGITGCVGAYATATTIERRKILASIRVGFTTIFQTLGETADALPVTLLFEDTGIEGTEITVNSPQWMTSFGDSLRSWERLLPAFDITLPHRLVLKGFFVARFGPGGRCEDVLKLVHDFNEDIFEQYMSISSLRRTFEYDGTYMPHLNWLRLPEIEALDRARLAFVEQIRELDSLRTSGDTELVLD
ncbi:MAG: lantibiotic dehydratase, partial [Candidatus Dormibacteraceae bacterium]